MQKVFNVAVDIGRKLPAPAFEVNTNDLKSVKLLITITNGQNLLNLTDTTVRIAIRKPDSHIIFQDCAVKDATGGQVEIILENQAYITPGTHTAEIMCYKGNEVVAVSGTFSYKSTKGIMNDEAVESKSEFTVINQKIEEARKLLEDIGESGVGVDEQARKDIQQVTTQLAETVKEVNGVKPTNGKITIPVPEVDTSKLATKTEVQAIASGSPKGTYATLAALQSAFPTGNTNIYLVTADGKWYYWNGTAWTAGGIYQSTGIAEGVITTNNVSPDKLAPSVLQGIKKTNSVNLFNKNTVRKGGFYQGGNGVWLANGAWVSSDFIPVIAGKTYKTNSGSNITRWDASQAFVGSISGTTFTIPEGTTFIRVATQLTNLDSIMVTLSNEYPSEYVPFDKYSFGKEFDVMKDIKVSAENINGVSLSQTVNLFNKETVKTGGYYESDGSWRAVGGWCSSDFIPIEEGKLYKKSNTNGSTFWDSNKNFINSAYNTDVVPAPKGTVYVRVAVRMTELDTFMVTLEEEYPNYYIPHKVYRFSGDWDVMNTSKTAKKINETDKKINHIDTAYSPKYIEPIRLDLEDFSGYNQGYHPSVVYVEGGFNGYKYWMASTPIPTSAQPYPERYEVPVIYKSNDGINWTVIDSANPLDDLTPAEIANTDYMSDPHVVYRPDTKTLEVWYRYTKRATDIPTIVCRKTTTDGTNWSNREIMIPEIVQSSGYIVQSPSVLWDNTRKVYRLWYYNSKDGVYYNELPDKGTYKPTDQRRVAFDDNLIYHHIDVNYFNGKYHFIGYHAGTPQNITHFISSDGLSFKKNKKLIVTGTGHPLYSGMLYRSVSLLNEQGKVMVYFSFNTQGTRGVGLLIADSFDSIQTVKAIDSNKVLLNNGTTLEELAQEVARLKALIETR